MLEEKDYIELVIQPASHEGFVQSIKAVSLDMDIINGMYRVYYDDPEDLYRLGLIAGRVDTTGFLSDRLTLPIKYSEKPPMPKKKK